MQNLMVVDQPALPITREPDGLQLADTVMRPYPQMEAAVVTELDRLTELADRDPLESLAQMLRLMQGIDVEILKCMAPTLLESAQQDASAFASGKREESGKRHNGRALAGMLKLQESIGKLGLARVRVRDEQERRSARPIEDTLLERHQPVPTFTPHEADG